MDIDTLISDPSSNLDANLLSTASCSLPVSNAATVLTNGSTNSDCNPAQIVDPPISDSSDPINNSNNASNTTDPPVEFLHDSTMPYHEQRGEVTVGPGAIKEACLLGLGLPKLRRSQEDNLARAKRYALEQSIKHVLLKQTVAHQQQQQKNAMYAQALSLMARVYVGSVSFELREETIRTAFSPFGPVKSINMSFDPITGHHKGFAFVEYELPEAASLAQEQMNGLLMGGRNIKVGRPSNMPQAQPIVETIMADAKKYNRIYVSSIHLDLTENDIKSVFEAFGHVTSIDLPKNPFNTKHRGYAYIDYETEKSAQDAVASMNLFDLGGQYLRVGRAVTPPQALQYMTPAANSSLPTASAVAAAAITAKIQALEATPTTTLAGASSAPPTVIVASTAPPLPVVTIPSAFGAAVPAPGVGPIFAVPPPGIAIPQLPASTLLGAVPSPPNFGVAAAVNGVGGGGGTPPSAPTRGFGPPPSVAVLPPPTVTPTIVVPPPLSTPRVSGFNAVPPPASLVGGVGFGAGVATTPFPVPPPPAATTAAAVASPTLPPQQQTPSPSATAKGPSLLEQKMQSAQTAQKLLQNPTLSEQQRKLIEMEAGQSLAAQEDIKIKGNEARNILMHKLMRRVESCVLVLRNMVGPEDVDESLQDEVQEECGNFGQVEQVIIYQEKQFESDDAPVLVKIFVKYSLPQEAETAKNKMDGRFFAGRRIKADIYDQNLFEHNDLSG